MEIFPSNLNPEGDTFPQMIDFTMALSNETQSWTLGQWGIAYQNALTVLERLERIEFGTSFESLEVLQQNSFITSFHESIISLRAMLLFPGKMYDVHTMLVIDTRDLEEDNLSLVASGVDISLSLAGWVYILHECTRILNDRNTPVRNAHALDLNAVFWYFFERGSTDNDVLTESAKKTVVSW
jgi:hypothetical protein